MPRSRNKHNKIEDLSSDHFTFRKTTYHGFPNGPTTLAYDTDSQILAIGTKHGEIRVYGRPGVEFIANSDGESPIISLFMISGLHQLISVSADNKILTWELTTEGKPALVLIKEFTLDPEGGKSITKCCLSQHSGHFYIGTEGGNLYTLDVKLFKPDPEIVYWNNATALIQSSSTAHPGKIVSLELCPINHNLILIGYEKGIIVLWDFEHGLPTKNFPGSIQDCQQPLESISWQSEGFKFVTSHSNSSLYYWGLTSSSPHEGPILHYGNSCSAIARVKWLNTDANPLIIFSGGLPIDHEDEHHTVTIIQGADHVALDFTSPVIDFVAIIDPSTQRGSVLFVLCEQELVAFDLEAPKCPLIRKPYLFCLHASPVTCVRLYESCNSEIYESLHEVNITSPPAHEHNSLKEWPAMGGCVRASEPTSYDILLTGHESGEVKFWDVTTGAMRLIYQLKTANLFVGQESQSALMEDFSDFKWPPYHKVGIYDPFEDDPRLAIKCIEFCPLSRTLCIGGNGGQVITFSLNPLPSETSLKAVKAEIFMGEGTRSRRGQALGTSQPLEIKPDLVQLPAGFQANFCLQCVPATVVTALAFRPSWGVVAAGNNKGFAVANFLVKQVFLIHPTVQHDGLSSRSISRMQSFRRSMRQSFRQRSSTVTIHDRRKIAESLNLETEHVKKPSVRPRASSESTSPIVNTPAPPPVATESKVSSAIAGLVNHLCFSDTHVSGGGPSPSIFASTMGSSIIRYSLTLPDPRKRLSELNKAFVAGKDYSLVHAAPIVSVFILDYDGIPIPGPYEIEARVVAAPNLRNPHYAVVCTSEQVKIVSLPGMKQKRKEKIHDRFQEKICKAWVIRVKVPAAPVGAARDWNPALAVLTEAGTFLAYSLPDLKMCFQEDSLVSSLDQKALQSLTVSVFGEILYLRSFSELQRCLLCSYGFSYHSSMLPSLFAYEGSTNPVRLPKKSSLRRRQVVQVEVTSEVSSSRERRSETPSPENVIDTSNTSDVPESKSPDYNISKDSSNGQIQPSDVTTDAIDLGHSVRQRSPPGDQPPITTSSRAISVSSSSSGSSSSQSGSSDDEMEADTGNPDDSTTFGNAFAMGLEDLGEGNQELDNIIASSLQQLESARAFYEHMQARVKKTE